MKKVPTWYKLNPSQIIGEVMDLSNEETGVWFKSMLKAPSIRENGDSRIR
jgi:hypothetical protein